MKPYTLAGPDVRTLLSNTTGLEIPVIAARGLVFSAWTPDKEDIRKLSNGEPLWLVQRGEAIPEMHMIVGRKDSVIPDPVKREAAMMRTPEVQRAAAIEALTRKYSPYVRVFLIVLLVATVWAAGALFTHLLKNLPQVPLMEWKPQQIQIVPYGVR